jgi:thiamine-phosphate pyrophosphorylase
VTVRRASTALRGLYAVTADAADTQALLAQVGAAIAGGARLIQYRNKTAAPELRLTQARRLKSLCAEHGATFIVNDHVDLALEVDADGVHIGAEDDSLARARQMLGAQKLVGVSCYNRLELARASVEHGANYVAFGSFFPSQVKPGAVQAPIALLADARREIAVPIAAIGGITAQNAPQLLSAGADMLAVITAVFGAADVRASAREFSALFEDGNETEPETF